MAYVLADKKEATLVLIVNENARTSIKNPNIKRKVVNIFSGYPIFQTLSHDTVKDIAKFCAEKDTKAVALFGGDGTLSCAMTTFANVCGALDKPLPVFCPLKAGTMNTVAKELGIPLNVVKLSLSLKRNFESKITFPTISKQTISIKDSENHTSRLCFVGGLGIAVNFLEEYYEFGAHGISDALRVTGKLVWSTLFHGSFSKELFRPLELDVAVDGRRLPLKSIRALLWGKIKSVGIEAKPLYFAPPQEGKMAFIAIDREPFHLLPKVLPIFTGKPLCGVDIEEGVAKYMKIDSSSSKNITIMADADIITLDLPIRVEQGPHVSLYCPIV